MSANLEMSVKVSNGKRLFQVYLIFHKLLSKRESHVQKSNGSIFKYTGFSFFYKLLSKKGSIHFQNSFIKSVHEIFKRESHVQKSNGSIFKYTGFSFL
jgi:hypothetical protein